MKSQPPPLTLVPPPANLRRMLSERVLLDYLRAHGPLSRAELARAVGFSKPTVSTALAWLMEVGLVREIGHRRFQGGGRTAILYEPNATLGYVVSIDVGFEHICVTIADLAGSHIAQRQSPRTTQQSDHGVALVSKLVQTTLASANLAASQVVYTVIGTPGIVAAAETDALMDAAAGRGDGALVAQLQQTFGPHLTIENDANLAAFGEHRFGLSTAVPTFVFLIIDAGLGMGVVLDGKLYRGAHGASGEIGFLPYPGAGHFPAQRDGLRHKGGMWQAASASGMLQRAQALGLPPSLTLQDLFAAAYAQPLAHHVIEQEGQHLAYLVAAIAATLDPDLIVFGGSIGQHFAVLHPSLATQLALLTPLRPRLAASTLGGDAVTMGALAIGLDIAHERVFATAQATLP